MSSPEKLLKEMVTNTGESLDAISLRHTILLVFLRHFGCTFCREALADLAKSRNVIEKAGAQLVFVHMTDNPTAERYFSKFNLSGVMHVSDSPCRFYQGFGLVKGNFNQLFGLQSWIRGFEAGILEGHAIGLQLGDGFQMPGVFVLQNSRIQESYIHKLASDRPDYVSLLAKCCVIDPTDN